MTSRKKETGFSKGLRADMAGGRLASGFMPAMIFPGEAGCRRNFADWKRFWTPERVEATRRAMAAAAADNFAPDAFSPFYRMISADKAPMDGLRISDIALSPSGDTPETGRRLDAVRNLYAGARV